MPSDMLPPRNLLMAWGFALVTAVAFTQWSSLFRSLIEAIVVLIARIVIVATIAVYFFSWLWMRPKR